MSRASHIRFLKTLPCCVCGDPQGSDFAHCKVLPNGRLDNHSMGKKPKIAGIDIGNPLCRHHHREQHTMSEAGFWTFYGIDGYGLATGLVECSGDTEKAMGLLGKAAREKLNA